MLQSSFRKLLAKKDKPDVLISIRYIVTLVAIFLLFLTSFGTAVGMHFRFADYVLVICLHEPGRW